MDYAKFFEAIKGVVGNFEGTFTLDDLVEKAKGIPGLDFQEMGTLGEKFAAAVKDGKIPGIKVAGKNEKGNDVYEVAK